MHTLLLKINNCKANISCIHRCKYEEHFNINLTPIRGIDYNIRMELNKMTAVSLAKPSKKDVRREKAKLNKSNSKCKNR